MKVVPHTFTNVKHFLLYKEQQDYILNQQEAKPTWTTSQLVLNDTEVKLVAINVHSNDATGKTKNTLKGLEDIHGSIVLKMNEIIVKAFNLYQ